MVKVFCKLNFFSLVAAVVLFFLPWTDLQCSQRHVAYQSGIQAIYGGFTVADDLQKQLEVKPAEEQHSRAGRAYLVAAALVFTALGLFLAFLALFGKVPFYAPGLAGGIALALLLLQSALGFPVNKSIRESKMPDASKEPLAAAVTAAIDVRADRTAWYYVEWAALAIPAMLTLNALVNERVLKTAVVLSRSQGAAGVGAFSQVPKDQDSGAS